MGQARRNISTRLDRVEQHLTELDRSVDAFVGYPGTYAVEAEQDPDGNEVGVYITALEQPPSVEWAPIIGDIVNGLGAALDNLVWSLSVKYQRRLHRAIPRGQIVYRGPFEAWRKVAFPVVVDPSLWPRVSTPRLRFIDPALTHTFLNEQPFSRRKHRPEREPLAVAHELWNVDKHRHVTVTSVWAGGEKTEIPITVPSLPGYEFPDPVWVAPRRVLKLKAKLKVAVAPTIIRTPSARIGGIEVRDLSIRRPGLPMEVHPKIPFEMAFKRGYPGYGVGVVDTLKAVHETARRLVTTLSREL